MKSMVYVGPVQELVGQSALVKRDVGTPEGRVEAQFDSFDLLDPRRPDAPEGPGPRGRTLAAGWHRFNASDFA